MLLFNSICCFWFLVVTRSIFDIERKKSSIRLMYFTDRIEFVVVVAIWIVPVYLSLLLIPVSWLLHMFNSQRPNILDYLISFCILQLLKKGFGFSGSHSVVCITTLCILDFAFRLICFIFFYLHFIYNEHLLWWIGVLVLYHSAPIKTTNDLTFFLHFRTLCVLCEFLS